MPRRQSVKALLAGFALAALAACGTSPTRTEPTLHVLVRASGGATVPRFLSTVAWADGRVDSLSCPADTSSASDGLRCTKGGFDIVGGRQASEITLRSSGNAFSSTRLDDGEPGPLSLVVSALAPAEITVDYATRLDGDNCGEALKELALPFQSDLGPSFSVKFYIRNLETEPLVYLQNTRKHPLHFEFAHDVLGIPGTADDFARDTYAGEGRSALAGTLISYPGVRGRARGATPQVEAPWTVSFFPDDPISPSLVRLTHRLLEERLTCLAWTGSAQRLVYVPASATRESDALADDAGFARVGIGWMTRAELFGGLKMQALNDGVAYGTLLRLTPEELANRVVSFRDIVLLTRLPNQLPLVGGTISEEFQTPLAHVNIAARSRGTPNLAYPEAFRDPEVSSRVGQLVRFQVAGGAFTLTETTLAEAEEFWNGSAREPYLPSFDASTTGIPAFAELGFADSIRVGSKAANLAELSRVLGEHAPREGLAIPFHYYDELMSTSQTSADACAAAENDCVASGRDADTCARARQLCFAGDTPESLAELVDRMLDDPDFKRDTALRDAALSSLRFNIEHAQVSRDFGDLLDQRVAEVFQDARVKLRSSTNAEDLPNFSGAGLYESYPAYARGDEAASKVVTKVFASVWTFRGFEERSFWNIDQRAVRMGCAINEAFSDELANGVLITRNIADPTTYGMYVNVQQGEASVTNPEHGQLPEIFSILGDSTYQVVRERFSSLSPEAPILSTDEVKSLYDAGAIARAHFARQYGRDVVLDIEFKLTPERQIVFKQARPYSTR